MRAHYHVRRQCRCQHVTKTQGVASLPEHVPGPASRARRRPRARPACLAAASPRCSAPRPSGACMQVVAVSTSVLQLIGTSAAHHADASSARQSQSQRCRGSSCLGSRPGATAQRISVFWVRTDAWLCAPPSDLQLEANAGPRVMWATRACLSGTPTSSRLPCRRRHVSKSSIGPPLTDLSSIAAGHTASTLRHDGSRMPAPCSRLHTASEPLCVVARRTRQSVSALGTAHACRARRTADALCGCVRACHACPCCRAGGSEVIRGRQLLEDLTRLAAAP